MLALCRTGSWRNFHNVVRNPLPRWRNSIVVHNATDVTVERTRTRQHIWITWRAIASLSRRPLLERPLLGEIEKDDPSVRKIRTYMLREIRVPFVYPIPPHCTRATKTLDVRFIVLLFTSRPKRKRLEQGRVHAMTKFDEFRYPKLKNFVEINDACIFFF